MKVTIKKYNAVATWRWNLKPGETAATTTGGSYTIETAGANDEDDEDDDVCGICRVAYEGCCPECKRPGDDCPLIFGECTHIFHMHCLLKWLGTDASKNSCPLDRRTWGEPAFWGLRLYSAKASKTTVTAGSKNEAKSGTDTPNAAANATTTAQANAAANAVVPRR